jgi:metallo-beta-lactamase class B
MPNFSRSLILVFTIVQIAFATSTSTAQTLAPLPNSSPEWVKDFAPFRIVGNLYYVGTYDLACYLITTPKGHILINTGIPGSDSMILRHVRALGFKVTDIHILLTNQAHFDHVGGMAAVQKATKAKMMVDAADAPILADGGNSDFVFGGKGPLFVPLNADRTLHDHDTIKLGDMAIVVLHHPGHTKGSCSYYFTVKDETRSWRVLIANIPTILDATRFPGMPAYPNVMKDYAYTLDTMPKIKFDLWFAAHAGQFDLHRKYQPGDSYNPTAFSDRAGYDAAIRDQQDAFAKRASAAAQSPQ